MRLLWLMWLMWTEKVGAHYSDGFAKHYVWRKSPAGPGPAPSQPRGMAMTVTVSCTLDSSENAQGRQHSCHAPSRAVVAVCRAIVERHRFCGRSSARPRPGWSGSCASSGAGAGPDGLVAGGRRAMSPSFRGGGHARASARAGLCWSGWLKTHRVRARESESPPRPDAWALYLFQLDFGSL